MAGPSVRPQRVSDFFWPPFLYPRYAPSAIFFPPGCAGWPHVARVAHCAMDGNANAQWPNEKGKAGP